MMTFHPPNENKRCPVGSSRIWYATAAGMLILLLAAVATQVRTQAGEQAQPNAVGSSAAESPDGLAGERVETVREPRLSAEDERQLHAIRNEIGSVVPSVGLLGGLPAGADESPPAEADSEILRLLPGDPLVQELRQLSQRVEQRARQEAGKGNWRLGLQLHELAQAMGASSS